MQQSTFLTIAAALAAAGSATALTGAVTAQHEQAVMALRRVMLKDRQFELCTPVTAPYTCERSCGTGYTECVSFPTCYNPGNGESCCSNGKYCPSGYYCTDAGCCPNGASLAECGAGEILPTLAPPSEPEETPTPTPIPEPEPTTTSYTTDTYTFSTEEPTTYTTTSTSYTPSPEPTTTTTTSSEPTTSTSTSSSSWDVPSVTPVPLPSPSVPPVNDAVGVVAAAGGVMGPVLGAAAAAVLLAL